MKLRAEFLKAHPYCQWFLSECGADESSVKDGVFVLNTLLFYVPASTEIHHKKGRGKYLLDTSTWMAVSDAGHRLIHANPKISYQKGYMLPRN